MKTRAELVDIATKAIRSNFAKRNTHVFVGSPQRHSRIFSERRRQIREWVGALRIARDPLIGTAIEQATNKGPLMAHDLRRCILTLPALSQSPTKED